MPPKHCLPVDENGFPVLGTNPYCKDGYGWLNEGECGCVPGSPMYDAARRGCSIRCVGIGPNSCPDCEKKTNWIMWGAVGLATFFILGRK